MELIAGILCITAGVISINRFNKAVSDEDAQKRSSAGWFVVAGVVSILAGLNWIAHAGHDASVSNSAQTTYSNGETVTFKNARGRTVTLPVPPGESFSQVINENMGRQ